MMVKHKYSLAGALLLSSSLVFSAPPSWYVSQDIKPEHHYIYVGYGIGDNIQQAKLMASQDISAQLSVIVDSTLEINKAFVDGGFSTSAKQRATQKTSAKLNNLSVLASDHVNGQYYIALEYQQLSIAQKFLKKMNPKVCEPDGHEKQHPYLAQTTLFEDLNKQLPCNLNIALLRKNRTWMLSYKDMLVQLDGESFPGLYANYQSHFLRMTTSSVRLKEGDTFTFFIESSETGYVTLFNVYGDGAVSLLESNIEVKENVSKMFPTPNDELLFEAGLLEKGKESLDMYVAVFSKAPQNFSQFTEASTEVFNTEAQFQFDRLLKILDKKNFSTVLLRVSPKV